MDVQAVAARPLREVEGELLVVALWQGEDALSGPAAEADAALGGAVRELLRAGDLRGKREETAVLYGRGALAARRLLLVGLGERAAFDADALRAAAAAAARRVRALRVRRYHVALPASDELGIEPSAAAQAVVVGSALGAYEFDARKTDTSSLDPPLEGLTLVAPSDDAEEAVRRGAERGGVIAEAVCLARDLANEPANYLTPTLLAETAERVAGEVGLRCEVLGEPEMAELGMGALLGVAKGSDEPARFIILEHNAGRQDLDTCVLIGKGITFDSGGISLKPSEGMEWMKDDMSGAAVVLAAMQAVARLGVPLHVVGLIPATENLPGGHAYRPGDVLESLSGQTIEVISTDAEGRLILADALAYAGRYGPSAVVDLATLTGACVTALGHVASGLMSPDDALADELLRASRETGERIWRLPLFEEYAEQIRSDVADVKNSGGRPAGAITAALFLQRFADGYPWAHLDIAGTAKVDATRGYVTKGATGHGVRLLVQWLSDRGAAG